VAEAEALEQQQVRGSPQPARAPEQVQALVQELALRPVPEQVPARVLQPAQEPVQVESPGLAQQRAARKKLHLYLWVPLASSSCIHRLAVPPTR